jgi:hypothetical protein
MERYYVVSNASTGVSWWAESPDGGTLRQAHSPASYHELLAKKCFFITHPGLFVFGTADGTSCCLVNSIPSGRTTGTGVVLESIMIVSDDGCFTRSMKALASVFLSDSPVAGDALAVESEKPAALGRLLELIVPEAGVIQVDWEEMRRRLEDTHLPGRSLQDQGDPSIKFDCVENRREMRRVLAGIQDVPLSKVLIAVSSAMPAEAITEGEVLWGLTDSPSLEKMPSASGGAIRPVARPSRIHHPRRWLIAAGLVLGIASALLFAVSRRR